MCPDNIAAQAMSFNALVLRILNLLMGNALNLSITIVIYFAIQRTYYQPWGLYITVVTNACQQSSRQETPWH